MILLILQFDFDTCILNIEKEPKRGSFSMLTSHVFPTQTKTRHQSHAANDGINYLCALKKRQNFGFGF